MILLEVRLDGGSDQGGALAFPVDAMVPDGRTPVAELTVVDVSETGDQLGTPVRHSVETLGADEGAGAFPLVGDTILAGTGFRSTGDSHGDNPARRNPANQQGFAPVQA